ncbi:MAG: hypothetical protein ABI418_03855, partial [Jatrophihabitantaceae bacterium]
MSWPASPAAILQNEHVLLRPVSPDDRQPLCAIALDPAIWRYFVVRIDTEAAFDAFFDAGGSAVSDSGGRPAGVAPTASGAPALATSATAAEPRS